MNTQGYFHRVQSETPTRFWINNPTAQEARKAIAAGAVGATTNPSYVSKLFSSPADMALVSRSVESLLPRESDERVLAAKVQAAMVGRIAELFMPLFRSSGGKAGFVTIQGDPFAETEAGSIIEEGVENRRIGANVMIKIPVTEPGIEAIDYFVRRDIPTMATEVMGLSQAVAICEAYREASRESGKAPPFYVTHITGILDDYFKKLVAERRLEISAEAMKYAGLSVAKRQYELLVERGYPGVMIGGGARKLEDFTELVGGDLAVTINWEGSAETLLASELSVVSRIGASVDAALVAELRSKLPEYSRALDIDGMRPAEFYDFGGVELFRNSFMKGWTQLLDLVAERRRAA